MHIQKRPDGRYQARYRGPDRKERSKIFDRKADAERWARDGETDRDRGDWVDPRSAKIKFRDRAEHWQATSVSHKPSTATVVEHRMRLHILPKWGDVPIRSIQRSEIQSWVAELSSELAPATVRAVYAHFGAVMSQAELDGVISRNPARKMPLPKQAPRAVVPFSDDQIDALLVAAGDWRGAIALAVGTGLRSAEMRALRSAQDSLDFLGQSVHVHQQWRDETQSMIEPKSEAGVRDVPVADWVLEEMSEHCARHGVQPGGFVFKSAKTLRPVRADRFRWVIRKAAAEAGVKRDDGGAIHWHDLRHTYASTLIRAGLNPKIIQRYLGHESIVQTFDVYGSMFVDDDDRAREALNRMRPAGGVRNRGGIRAV